MCRELWIRLAQMEAEKLKAVELAVEEEGEMERLVVLIGTPSRGKWSW